MKIRRVIIMNVVLNLPVSIAMSIAASLLHGGLSLNTIWFSIIGFVLSFIITILFPIPKINASFSSIFHLKATSTIGRWIGNLAGTLVYVTIIGMVMTVINVGFIMPTLFYAFLDVFPVLFISGYFISSIISPLAEKVAGLEK